jgi:beta-galactosidase
MEYSYKNKPLITGALKPNFWRPLTDNDLKGWHADELLEIWEDLPEKLDITSFEPGRDENIAIIKTVSEAEGVTLQLDWTVDATGALKVDYRVSIPEDLPELLKVGMQTHVARELEEMSFFGKGPFENYSDRQWAARLGWYEGTVDDFYYSHVFPQEMGNHTQVSFLALQAKNHGLAVKGNGLNVSVLPYTMENVREAQHTHELEDAGALILNIDHAVTGVGGTDTWSIKARPIDPYRLLEKEYAYSFIIQPAQKKAYELFVDSL